MAMCKALVIECAHDVRLLAFGFGISSCSILIMTLQISWHEGIRQLYKRRTALRMSMVWCRTKSSAWPSMPQRMSCTVGQRTWPSRSGTRSMGGSSDGRRGIAPGSLVCCLLRISECCFRAPWTTLWQLGRTVAREYRSMHPPAPQQKSQHAVLTVTGRWQPQPFLAILSAFIQYAKCCVRR